MNDNPFIGRPARLISSDDIAYDGELIVRKFGERIAIYLLPKRMFSLGPIGQKFDYKPNVIPLIGIFDTKEFGVDFIVQNMSKVINDAVGPGKAWKGFKIDGHEAFKAAWDFVSKIIPKGEGNDKKV